MAKTIRRGLFRILPWSMVGILIFAFAMSTWQMMPVKDAKAAADITINNAEVKVTSSNTVLVTFNDPGQNLASADFTKWHIDAGGGGVGPLDPISAEVTSAGTPWTVTLTFIGTPFSDTATSYAAASGLYADASAVTDLNADTNAVVAHDASIAIADGQAPTFTAARTALNTIVLTFSENVTGTAIADSFTVVGASSVTNTAVTAGTSVTLTTVGLTATDGTPAVGYVSATGDIVDDSAALNEIANGGAIAAADQVAPTFTAARTALNTIVLTFSENVTGTAIADSFTVVGASSVTNTAVTAGTSVTLTTVGLTATDGTPAVGYVSATGDIVDDSAALNEIANGGAIAAADQVAPTFTAARTALNTIVLTFSENVNTTTTDGSGYAVEGATVTVNTDPAGSSTSMTLTTTGLTSTSSTPAVTYTTLAGTTVDASAAANEVANASTANATDQVAPTILSSTPSDGYAGYSRTGNIEITFSEAMTTGSVTVLTVTGSPTIGTPTFSWASGNTVLTIDPSITLVSSTSYVITVSASVTDASAALNAIVADTITFTSASGSDGGGGGGGGGSAVTSTTPTITLGTVGSLTSGETKNLTWTVGGSGIDTVALYYSTNSGATYNQIAYNLSRTLGTYAWTVPSVDTDTAMVKIVAYDSGKAQLDTDVSAVFSIALAEGVEEVEGAEAEDTDITELDSEGRTVALDSGEIGASPLTGEEEAISEVVTGQFIRSYGYSTIYYVDENLNRRPFWDTNTFFTYADSFDEVVWVTDATLPTLSIGQPMLPAPGVVLVKIQSDPKTYAIDDGSVLRWIPDEATAISLYGTSWSGYVIDLEPTVFSKFTTGEDMTTADIVDTSIMKTRDELAALAQ